MLAEAPLYWVNPSMVEFVRGAALDVPSWTPAVAAPSETGFLLWSKPVTAELGVVISGRQESMTLDGVYWMFTGSERQTLSISLLSRMLEFADDQLNPGVRFDSKPLWVSEGFTIYDAHIEAGRIDSAALARELGHGDDGLKHVIALIGATWLLSSQENLASTHALKTQAPKRGLLPSAATTETLEYVQVVDVQPRPGPETGGRALNEDERPAREYTHRWWVGKAEGGFWRQQACGPRHSQRKPLWIQPFVKGPKDKPLLKSPTVKVIR
ncbi:hypothetical protein [Nocardia sp. NPDC050435]|uniref:hypothetical protein n=1 Tax=Nocardia sp. NPDC050435 TaxID=3155040 RepID=UPI00340D6F19